MKNRFFVISKEKIYAYVVSVFTVVTLFFMSSVLNSDLLDTGETSSNVVEVNNNQNIINNVIN